MSSPTSARISSSEGITVAFVSLASAVTFTSGMIGTSVLGDACAVSFVVFIAPPSCFGPPFKLNMSKIASCAVSVITRAPPVSGATRYKPNTTAPPILNPRIRCNRPIFFALRSKPQGGVNSSLIGISSSVKFGKIQKCSPNTIHTNANTIARTLNTTANVPRMAKHTYRITFLNQIGASGNKHINTTPSANAALTATLAQLIGGVYIHA
mmetsp:Transcript_8128/g.26897  ORF Transcript_8128/g.26897 Transcript_8128/m.26897 type:complete len:210 (-) Transcript_8128:429-1058(-)